MLYLLDANVLIRAHEDYYPIDRVPPFWNWLLAQGAADSVKIPFEIHDEIVGGQPVGYPLRDWLAAPDTLETLVLEEEVDAEVFNRVLAEGYAPDLTDDELEEIGRDPFLIAYALMGNDRAVVTKEVSATSQVRGRRKIPDACNILGVTWMNDFQFYKAADFRIALGG